MVKPKTEPPHLNERGDEAHPAWGLIGASRVSHSPPGAALFDSDIKHNHFVVLRIRRASRKRDLYRDWKHGEDELIEVAMSEAQWASFVSTLNMGDGVPCTIERVGNEFMPGVEYEPRLAVSMDEVSAAATKALEHIQTAFDAYKESKSAKNRKALESAIANAPANLRFAAESLSEHAENVVSRARADIEAAVVSKARQLGIDPAEIATPHNLLEAGNDED